MSETLQHPAPLDKPDKPLTGSLVESDVAELLQQYELGCTAGVRAMKHFARCGEILNARRKLMKHGEWLLWLNANVPFSQQSASVYMRLARRLATNPELLDSSNFSLHCSVVNPRLPKAASAPDSNPDSSPEEAPRKKSYTVTEHCKALAEAVGKADCDARAEVEAKYAALRRELAEARDVIEAAPSSDVRTALHYLAKLDAKKVSGAVGPDEIATFINEISAVEAFLKMLKDSLWIQKPGAEQRKKAEKAAKRVKTRLTTKRRPLINTRRPSAAPTVQP